jgi:hypothetical protein
VTAGRVRDRGRGSGSAEFHAQRTPDRGHNTVETKLFSSPDYVFLEVDDPRRPVNWVENPGKVAYLKPGLRQQNVRADGGRVSITNDHKVVLADSAGRSRKRPYSEALARNRRRGASPVVGEPLHPASFRQYALQAGNSIPMREISLPFAASSKLRYYSAPHTRAMSPASQATASATERS